MAFELDYGDSSAAVSSTAGTAEDLRGDFQAGHRAAGDVAEALANSPVVAGALTSLRGEVLYSLDSVGDAIKEPLGRATQAVSDAVSDGAGKIAEGSGKVWDSVFG